MIKIGKVGLCRSAISSIMICLSNLAVYPSVYATNINIEDELNRPRQIYTISQRGISYIVTKKDIVLLDRRGKGICRLPLTELPSGAEVRKAFLYWMAEVLPERSADTKIRLHTPIGDSYDIYADDVWSTVEGGLLYLCRKDITRLILKNGVYTIADIDMDPTVSNGELVPPFGMCWLVVIYKLPGYMVVGGVSLYDGLSKDIRSIQDAEINSEIGIFIKEGKIGFIKNYFRDSRNVTEQDGIIVTSLRESRPFDAIYLYKRMCVYIQAGRILDGLRLYFTGLKHSPKFFLKFISDSLKNRMYVNTKLLLSILRPIVQKIVLLLSLCFFIYMILINSFYLLLTIIAFFLNSRLVGLKKGIPTDKLRDPVIPISVLISAHNENAVIRKTIEALLKNRYPRFEVIIINDGSTDNTFDVLNDFLHLEKTQDRYTMQIPTAYIKGIYGSKNYPNVYVIDKVKSGKADSLNAGLNFSRYPLFCTIDADTILEEGSLIQLAKPVLNGSGRVIATTGMVRLNNGCVINAAEITKVGLPKGLLGLLQVVEYIRAYVTGRIGWNLFNAHLIISGTFSLYRKDLVLALGGYHPYAIGEDVELNMRVQRYLRDVNKDYRIVYVPKARCFTQAPEDIKSFARQRSRWQIGLLTCIRLNQHIMFNPKYKFIGSIALPFYAFLELPAPVIEFFGYIVMPVLSLFNMLSFKVMCLLLGAVICYGLVITTVAIFMDVLYFRFYSFKGYLQIFLASLLEWAGFHQFTVLCRLKGMYEYHRRIHIRVDGWHSPDRFRLEEAC